MIASLEAGKRQVFRLALAPSIVNPSVNRLWLIPPSWDGEQAVDFADFDYIGRQFRRFFVDLGQERVAVIGLILSGVKRYRQERPLGYAYFEVFGERQPVYFSVECADEWNGKIFQRFIAHAGASIPNRVREAVTQFSPSTAFAWWMATVWKFSTIQATTYRMVESAGDEYDDSKIIGICWSDPISASLSAIEAASLIGPDVSKLIVVQGEWSAPMSKAEFAKRILQKKLARARDVNAIFDGYEKQQLGPNKWIFRLDTLPPGTRKKLESGPI